ncbi:MAG: DNA alkylation repair protein, partial [Burkholderiaceae bacterium]|nr:DNA alkylation repair protein [Burkholderiaceae bacterium]
MFEYVRLIQEALGDVANVEHAKPMKAYMKAQFEFLGVPA